MVSTSHISHTANDRSYFANIKKQVHHYAVKLQLPPARISETDIIVAELTSNLFKHSSSGGEILTSCDEDENGEFLEIISIDNGPGFTNIDRVMQDGYSTTGTLGAGLGSIRKLSDVFDIYTHKNWGTILLSRIYKTPLTVTRKKRVLYNTLIIAKPGETCSGDGCSFLETVDGFKILHADGLGHGPEAKHVADIANTVFLNCVAASPSETLLYLHEHLGKTRGMVANVIMYNARQQSWSIAGVGNICTKWIGTGGDRSYTASSGIIGHILPSKINELTLARHDFQQFISCSDGIKSRWNTTQCKAAQQHRLLIQAVAVYKDFARRTDDVSVVVCKINEIAP